MCISRITDICKWKVKKECLGSVMDKHTKGRVGSKLEKRSRVGNLLLMISHGVRQKVEGSLVRSRACGGKRGMRVPVYIYRPPAHRSLRSTVVGRRCFKWHTTEHTKASQVAKAKQALEIHKIFRHGLFTLHCLDAGKKNNTYLSRLIAKSVNRVNALRG